MRSSGIPLFSIPKGMEQPGREETDRGNTHHGDAFWFLTAPATSCALALVITSPVLCHSVFVPTLLRAPACSIRECQTAPTACHLPTFLSPCGFYLGRM